MIEEQQQQKRIEGIVTSDRMDKTITVKTVRKVRHKLYKKYVNKTSTYHVHDEDESANVGDVVAIEACRPLSRTKMWKLIEVVEKHLD